MLDNSRQWPSCYHEVSLHHLARYEFASKRVQGRVLDAACGVGYGSLLMQAGGTAVVGIDGDERAIQWANHFFYGPRYIHGRIEEKKWLGNFDSVVSLETLEHVQNPSELLKIFRAVCKGNFIASVPNENVHPFRPETYLKDSSPHYRHYTPEQFDDILKENGFEVFKRFSQKDKANPEVVVGTDGMFLVYACY